MVVHVSVNLVTKATKGTVRKVEGGERESSVCILSANFAAGLEATHCCALCCCALQSSRNESFLSPLLAYQCSEANFSP